MDAEVAMVGRAVETEVDAEGDRSPGGILLAAVKADLEESQLAPLRVVILNGVGWSG